jgi:hypothetical protein
VVAIGNDRDLAGTGAVSSETFSGIVFHWLLVAADEKHRAPDSFGVLDQVWGVGQTVEVGARRDNPPPGWDEHELSRLARGYQRFGFLHLRIGISGQGKVAGRSGIGQAIAAGVGGQRRQ